MSNREPATITHEDVTIGIQASTKRPASYNKAKGNSLLVEAKRSSSGHQGRNADRAIHEEKRSSGGRQGRNDKAIHTSNVQYDSRSVSVNVDKPMSGSIVAQNPDHANKPKDFVVTSCAVLLLCNFIFGFLAYNSAVKSNWAWQLGDLEVARKRRRTTKIFMICGIVCGVATYVLVITLIATCCSPFNN